MRPRLTYANAMATIAVLVALGGSAYAFPEGNEDRDRCHRVCVGESRSHLSPPWSGTQATRQLASLCMQFRKVNREMPPLPRASSALGGGGGGSVLFHLEGGAAAAGGDDVRVVDLKAGALEAFDVVDLGAEDELHADLVDDDRDAVDLEYVVVLLGAVEGEGVLEAGAAAAADGNPQGLALGVVLAAEELADLRRSPVAEGDGLFR